MTSILSPFSPGHRLTSLVEVFEGKVAYSTIVETRDLRHLFKVEAIANGIEAEIMAAAKPGINLNGWSACR